MACLPRNWKFFFTSPGKRPTVVSAEPTETLRAFFLSRLDVGNDGAHDILVFVGECEHALTEGEDSPPTGRS